MSSSISVPAFPLKTAPTTTTVADLVATARAGLYRLEPAQAFAAWHRGAVLVDIRTAAQRDSQGQVPGVIAVERNVLEWRFDPASENRLPIASYDLQVIILCAHGHTSSLAAASLQQLGVRRATDVIGGFQGWRAAGLPVYGGSIPREPALVPHPDERARRSGAVDVRPAERRAYVAGRELELTRREFDLLAHLVTAPHRVHSRTALLARLWDDRMFDGSRTIDVHVHRLRNKLGEDVGQALETVRGVGYRWSPPADEAA
jgi:rhodanese-related sulfurtransferase